MSFVGTHRSPFGDDPDWYYMLHTPLTRWDARRFQNDNPPPPPPSIIIGLNFATQTVCRFRNNPTLYFEPRPPSPTESMLFNPDISLFHNRFYGENVIRSMFLSTSTGAALSVERRHWMVPKIYDFIVSYIIRGSVSIAVDEIHIELDVVDEEVRYTEGEDEDGNWILDDSFEPPEQHDDDLNWIHEESSEDVQLSARPAPQALLDSLVTEVFHDEEEAMNCIICLEEVVAGTEVKRLPCSHRFHGHCIDGWFEGRDSCPLCRFTLHVEDEEE